MSCRMMCEAILRTDALRCGKNEQRPLAQMFRRRIISVMQIVETNLNDFLAATKNVAKQICAVLDAVNDKTITMHVGIIEIDKFVANLNEHRGMETLLAPIKEFARQARQSLLSKLS